MAAGAEATAVVAGDAEATAGVAVADAVAGAVADTAAIATVSPSVQSAELTFRASTAILMRLPQDVASKFAIPLQFELRWCINSLADSSQDSGKE